jgi:uncharacterized HAD superfamily protein
MQFRSLSDLSRTIRDNLYKIPRDVDLIVGIPRSGVLAGVTLGLMLNLPVVDLETFLANGPVKGGERAKLSRSSIAHAHDAKQPLVFDDSIATGSALGRVKARIQEILPGKQMLFGAVYATQARVKDVDIFLEVVPTPRVFEWNVMHHVFLEQACVDIDGVLCVDPSQRENDDGELYLKFLREARPLVVPTRKVGFLVTSRLEKYRKETETWMSAHGVHYNELLMLDLPSAAERRRMMAHAKFKASVYKGIADAPLFIESERQQAAEISHLSGKAVLCFSTQELFTPQFSIHRLDAGVRRFRFRAARKIRHVLGLNQGDSSRMT